MWCKYVLLIFQASYKSRLEFIDLAPSEKCPVKECPYIMTSERADLLLHWKHEHMAHHKYTFCSDCYYITKKEKNLKDHYKNIHRYPESVLALAVKESMYTRILNKNVVHPGNYRIKDLDDSFVPLNQRLPEFIVCPSDACSANRDPGLWGFRQHWMTKHLTLTTYFACPDCPFRSQFQDALSRHLKAERGPHGFDADTVSHIMETGPIVEGITENQLNNANHEQQWRRIYPSKIFKATVTQKKNHPTTPIRTKSNKD